MANATGLVQQHGAEIPMLSLVLEDVDSTDPPGINIILEWGK